MAKDARVRLDIEATGVARLTLTRPEKYNALSQEMIVELSDYLTALSVDERVRILVLQGEGSSFCSGADLVEMRAQCVGSTENLMTAEALSTMFGLLNDFPKPTIAKVQGGIYGGGVGLLCCCDMVVAAKSSQFCMSEVRLGLSPAVISRYVIGAIGLRQARRYCLSAEIMTAKVAERLQLVHEVVDADDLERWVEDWCECLLAAGPRAAVATKELIVSYGSVDDYSARSCRLIAELRASEEGQEGLAAFFAKRVASFNRSAVYRAELTRGGSRG